jgi:hypothetical protein
MEVATKSRPPSPLPAKRPSLPSPLIPTKLPRMIHENLLQSIEGLSARIIAIRDSL